MTLRAYLTLLRPVRTLLLSAFYGWAMGFTLLKTFGGVTVQETLFLTCTIIGPVTLGAFLLGPLHEVMHRSFSALLPDLRTVFRRRHLIACGIAAVSCFFGAELLGYPFPRTASAGLILASLSAPLLNRRRSLVWGALSGMAGYVALVVLLVLPTRSLLLDAGRSFPWAILVAGSAFAVFCFHRGFSAEGLRERSRGALLFCCFQTSIPLVGSGGFVVARHIQAENSRLVAARKANTSGRAWAIASVGSSLREWAAVVRHCRFGGTRLRQHLFGLLLIGGSPLVMVALIQFFTSRTNPDQPVPFSEFFALLAAAFRPGSAPDPFSTLLYLFALLFGLCATTSLTAALVLAPYRLPLSRERLARSTLLETHRLTGLIAVAFAVELCAIAIVTTLATGGPLAPQLLTRPLAVTLILIPTALIVQAFVVRTARDYWFLIAGLSGPLLVGAIAGALTTRHGARAAQYSPATLLDAVFTPTGLAILLTVGALAAALHWLAVRRHFRTCDFSRPLMLVASGRSA